MKNKPVNKGRAKNNVQRVMRAETPDNNTEEPIVQDIYQQSEQSEEDFNRNNSDNEEREDHDKQNDYDELVLRDSTKFNKLDEQRNASVYVYYYKINFN